MGVRLIVRPREATFAAAPGFHEGRADGLAEGLAGAGDDEWVFEFEQDRVLLGRGSGVDVSLPDRSISSRHASLRVEASSRVVLIDHGSTNGTRVNGQALIAERPRALRDGDRIEVGPFRVEVRLGVAVAAPTSRERTVSLARRILSRQAGEDVLRPRIVVLNGPKKGAELVLPMPPARLRIGRAETNALFLDDADASREHAELSVDLDGVTLRDLGSKNGLEIGGRRVTEKRLRDRDEILIGATVLSFEDPAESVLKERESLPDVLADLSADRRPEPTLPIPVLPIPVLGPEAPAQASAVPDAQDAQLPDPQLPDPHREPAPRPPPPAPPAWPKRSFTAELAVLLLAGLVLAASAVGLYWLMGAS